MEAIPFLMFMLVFMGVIGAMIWGFVRTRKTGERWAGYAKSVGLYYGGSGFFGPGQFYGRYKGGSFEVHVHTFSRGSGKSRTTYTRVKTSFNPPLTLGLKLYREHLVSTLGKMLGTQDIETGDKAFDDPYMIKGRNVEGIVSLLNADLRAAIRGYDQHVGNIEIDDSGVTYEERGVISDVNRIDNIIQSQLHLAAAFGVASASEVMHHQAEQQAWAEPY